jgi:hypothetical protein
VGIKIRSSERKLSSGPGLQKNERPSELLHGLETRPRAETKQKQRRAEVTRNSFWPWHSTARPCRRNFLARHSDWTKTESPDRRQAVQEPRQSRRKTRVCEKQNLRRENQISRSRAGTGRILPTQSSRRRARARTKSGGKNPRRSEASSCTKESLKHETNHPDSK